MHIVVATILDAVSRVYYEIVSVEMRILIKRKYTISTMNYKGYRLEIIYEVVKMLWIGEYYI